MINAMHVGVSNGAEQWCRVKGGWLHFGVSPYTQHACHLCINS